MYKWIRQYDDVGHVNRKYSSGRKRITTAENDNLLVRHMELNPLDNVSKMARKYGIKRRTALNRINEAGLKCYTSARQHALTRIQKDARIKFCKKMLRYKHRLEDIIFTDEKIFCSEQNNMVKVYRPYNQRYNEKYITNTRISGRISCGYWGWISSAGPGELVRIDNKFNTQTYLNILNDSAFPTIKMQYGSLSTLIFQQDNHPVHSSKQVKNFLYSTDMYWILNWPPNSPDLNLIENVWSKLVYDWPFIQNRTIPNLNNIVERRWEQLRFDLGIINLNYIVTQSTLDSISLFFSEYFKNLYASLPQRFEYVIQNDGNWYQPK